jgi:hypothetical protein
MANPGPDGFPALFRAGDIGVSSEWRDITYDWTPILTADGVFIYSYLRDMFDNQRTLRPFILDPDGPTKQRIQRILGRRTSWAIQGPEYLLATVGLVHAEVQYGSSVDLERPHHTATTYYVVGRLDHPVLDWTMLGRVLDALIIALEPLSADPLRAAQQKNAQAALRSLGQAGMLQHIDPEDLFDPDGAWPALLPTLIQDQRWTQLFVHLHGFDALQSYRQQARTWVEWAQRRAARLMEENRAIARQLLAAQRRAPRGGGQNGAPSQPQSAGTTLTGHGHSGTLLDRSQQPGTSSRDTFDSKSFVPEGRELNQGPAGVSLASPQGPGVTQAPSETGQHGSYPTATIPLSQGVPDESLCRNQINLPWWGQESEIHHAEETAAGNTLSVRTETVSAVLDEPETPLVAPHLRDEELSTTRQDAQFWQAIQQILYGDQRRYAYTEGEKKAAYRLFKRTETPIGIVLAALRAVMSLPESQRPRRFGDALKQPVFHHCVQQALALVQARPSEESATWPQFLQSYRSIGHSRGLRDVSVPEYHVLKALFEQQPNECWEVLQRAEQAAQPPQLSVAYLRRAINNNQQALALRSMQANERGAICARVPGKKRNPRVPVAANESLAIDPRRELLLREGVNPAILNAGITIEHIQCWLAEADARQAEIKDRAAWLAWGIRSGRLPKDHPKLPPNTPSAPQSSTQAALPSLPSATSGDLPSSQSLDIWQAALNDLRRYLPYSEFETWIKETSLIQLADQQAIVGTPNIFARDKVSEAYAPLIADTLQSILGSPVQVAVVLDSRLAFRR